MRRKLNVGDRNRFSQQTGTTKITARAPTPGTSGPKFSWYLGCPVAVIVARVRPWNDCLAVTMTGSAMPSLVWACFRASWRG